MAQSVKHLTLAQVMISQFMGSSLASGSVLTTQSLESSSDSVSVSLRPFPTHNLSLCLKNKHLKKEKEKNTEGNTMIVTKSIFRSM